MTHPFRVAVNMANPATVSVHHDGTLSGPCIDLASKLQNELGWSVRVVQFRSAREAIEAQGSWDAAFLAIDPARMDKLNFSRPYLKIEATLAVGTSSPCESLADLDCPGVRIASSASAAYDLAIQRLIKFADVVQHENPAASFTAFRAGGFDAVAGVRAALESAFVSDPGVRILPDHFVTIDHAMATPLGQKALAQKLDDLVARHLASF